MFTKIKEWVGDNFFWIITIMFVFIMWNNCSQSRTNTRLVKNNINLVQEIDSIKRTIPNEERLVLLYQKEMYEFLINSLYDWNSVVRTTQRPDDVIIRYREEIKKIDEKLGK
jgi:hypothetical protein